MSSSTAKSHTARAIDVRVTGNALTVELADGRIMAVPLTWFPRLQHATMSERRVWRLIGGGQGVHWPEIDEDISVANLLAGQPSGESHASLKKWLANRVKSRRKTPRA